MIVKLAVGLFVALTGLFVVSIGLIRAQSTASTLFGVSLTHANCTVLCLMGIQPGRTSFDTALEILTHHDWVTNVGIRPARGSFDSDQVVVVWDWSGAQPAWIDSSVNGRLRATAAQIDEVRVATRLELGAIRLELGAPVGADAGFVNTTPILTIYQAIYPAEQMLVLVRQNCPAHQVWRQPVTLTFTGLLPERDRLLLNRDILPHRVRVGCQAA